MSKFKPIYTEIITIVHGKSEYELASYIKSNLRIKMEIESENRGKNSIQINSLMSKLNNTNFKNKKSFIKKYGDIDMTKGFFIFPIMDTDDCNDKEMQEYINKSMFQSHWLYEHIIPIYNITNLEDVLKKAGVQYSKKDKGKYVDIFPTNRGQADIQQIIDFNNKIKSAYDINNMHVFIDKCIEVQSKYPKF